MRRISVLIIMLAASWIASAQSEVDHVLRVIGVHDVEEADAEEVERLTDILHNPLKLNMASRARLEASGLFTPFQIAAVDDYRLRHGDIMSLTELASIDGFNARIVGDISPFINLDSYSRASDGVDADISGRSTFKKTDDEHGRVNYGVRSRLSVNEIWGLSFSCSRGYDDPKWRPSSYSANVVWNHRYGVLVVGDFNARFGQGLCLWNTVSFNYLSSPSTFMRRASGLSPSYSFTGTNALTGIAADLCMDKWKLSCMLGAPEVKSCSSLKLRPAVNLTRRFSFGHIGITHVMDFADVLYENYTIPYMRSSADASLCLKGTNVFGEAMFDWLTGRISYLAGAESSLGEYATVAGTVRNLPASDEHGLALGGEFAGKRHDVLFSSDLVYHPSGKSEAAGKAVQLKAQAKWKWSISGHMVAEIRVAERIRTWGRRLRTDLRGDLIFDDGTWMLASRFNVLKSAGVGLLGYVEGAFRCHDALKLYLRQGIFRIDIWDDRIYVYERDAPSSFNVPAFYGRGVWSSTYLSWKFARWGSLYFRASYISYPFMKEKKKPGKAELKLQFSLHF